jgi:hypothetical protein
VQTLRDIAPWLALAAGALSLVLLVLVLVLWARLRGVRRAQAVIMGPHEQRDLVAHGEQLASQVRNLRQAVEGLTDRLEAHKRRLDQTLTHRSLVRYDAVRDAGGEQSATVVLLDDRRSGIVMSTIAARDFARVYVKTLENGVPDRELSPEERRAVSEAVPDPLPPAAPPEAPAHTTRTRAHGAPADDRPSDVGGEPHSTGAAPSSGAGQQTPQAEPAPDDAGKPAPLGLDEGFYWESSSGRHDADEPHREG